MVILHACFFVLCVTFEVHVCLDVTLFRCPLWRFDILYLCHILGVCLGLAICFGFVVGFRIAGVVLGSPCIVCICGCFPVLRMEIPLLL